MGKNVVSIVKMPKKPSEKEIDASVRKAIELAGGLTDIIFRGNTVLIKPNLVVAHPPETGTTTDPRVCKSIANLVREIGAKPIIAESSAAGVDTEEAFKVAGYSRLRDEGFEVIDLKKQETTKVSIPKGKSLKEVSLPRVVVDADVIINVPKMKTHDNVLVTLSLKNMKGVLPDTFKKKFHTTFGVPQSVADLHTVVRPALAVVDGIIAQEGMGPMFGTPVEMSLIIAGRNPVAVDAITSVIMGFKPREDQIIDAAVKSGIGTADLNEIKVVGESISNIQRRFKSADETALEVMPEGFQLLLGEKACSACRNSVTYALMTMKNRNLLDKAAEWTMVVGKIDKLPEVDREFLLLAGKCTSRFKSRGVFVDGCPVSSWDVVGRILGIKGAEAKLR
jgi:uncharacterized protein (DUF362 family)